MKIYDSSHIKNIALFGATKSGKTTLAETMLFEGGVINRRGAIEDGTTLSDYTDIEQDKGHSIYTSILHTEWRDYKINIIDTPGNDNFIGEVFEGIRAADTCIVVLNAAHGVEIGTELIWRYLSRAGKPVIVVVNQLDHEKANFDLTLEQARATFGKALVPMQYPVNPGPGFSNIIDLLKMTDYQFRAEGGKPEKLPIPDSEKAKADEWHNALVEAAAEGDDSLMELYFEKGNLDEDHMRYGLKIGMLKGKVIPLFCISAKQNMGTGRLMGFIDNVCPSAIELLPVKTQDGHAVTCDPNGPVGLFVFKTTTEPHLGEVIYFKVHSGTLTHGVDLVNSRTKNVERFGQLFVADGKKKHPVDKLVAGDIGVTVKLKEAHVNDSYYTKGKEMAFMPIEFPPSRITLAVKATVKNNEEKMQEALYSMQKEDPTFRVHYSSELKQTLMDGQGEMQFENVKWLVKHHQNIDMEFLRPRISYRETIQGSAKAEYRHKKQSGGAGQFAEVHMLIDPWTDGMPDPHELKIRDRQMVDLGTGGVLAFYNCIVGGDIDARFIPSVMKGIMEKMQEGPLTGSPVRDVRVCLFGGKMHPVDSNDISFKIAATMAFRDAFINAKPRLLEPVFEVDIVVPDEFMGEVITDVQNRRGLILGMESDGHFQKVKARIPDAEMYKYATALRSLTQGRATHTRKFAEYAPVADALREKIMAEFAATVTAE